MSGGLQNTTPDIRVRESVRGWGICRTCFSPAVPCGQSPGARAGDDFGRGDFSWGRWRVKSKFLYVGLGILGTTFLYNLFFIDNADNLEVSANKDELCILNKSDPPIYIEKIRFNNRNADECYVYSVDGIMQSTPHFKIPEFIPKRELDRYNVNLSDIYHGDKSTLNWSFYGNIFEQHSIDDILYKLTPRKLELGDKTCIHMSSFSCGNQIMVTDIYTERGSYQYSFK